MTEEEKEDELSGWVLGEIEATGKRKPCRICDTPEARVRLDEILRAIKDAKVKIHSRTGISMASIHRKLTADVPAFKTSPRYWSELFRRHVRECLGG